VRLENAKANQVRLKDLFDRGVASRKEVEDADREVSDAQAALAQAQAGRNASQTLAGRQTVTATFDGVIAKRFHNPGDFVEASASNPVLRVIDPARLQVDASVAISDLSRIVMGAAGRLIVSTDAPPLQLKVVSRPAAVEPGTAAAPVRLNFTTAHSFAVGTPVQVEIDAEQQPMSFWFLSTRSLEKAKRRPFSWSWATRRSAGRLSSVSWTRSMRRSRKA
jgi:multidrug resistance efflux pump